MITLYDSLSRSTKPLEPIDPSQVTMYVCGPTVYSEPHIGNARTAVVFDVLYRLLRHRYASVSYARNFTDIDDKIMDRAAELGIGIDALTESVIDRYHDLSGELNIATPTHEPRATESMPEIIGMITRLVEQGHAYLTDGHVLFSIASFPDHGRLSAHLQSHLISGHRVAVPDYKRGDNDFVLWKPSTDDQPGWDSPWGRGRPGWHIECSAMIRKHLGSTIDIHGGGADLRFPHHDSEISQSTCANHAPLANIWMHVAMLTVNGRKMSKSLGNVVLIGDAIARHGAQAVRLSLMRPKHTKPLDWTDGMVAENAAFLRFWHKTLATMPGPAVANQHSDHILSPLHHNLNVNGVVSNIQRTVKHITVEDDAGMAAELAAGLRYAAGVIGLDLVGNHRWMPVHDDDAEVQALVDRRTAARAAGDWALADGIRAQLLERGVVVSDGKPGSNPVWRRA